MNKRYWNLLVPNTTVSLPASEQFGAFAIAYLDSAERLCRILARSHRKATYERGSVVLYLTAHAIELFLKGAILRRAPKERFGHHDLELLHNRYNKLYPEKKLRFDMPFRRDYGNMIQSEIDAVKKLSPPIDQLYRYPQDKEGKPWFGLFSFEANSFQQELSALRLNFERLFEEYGT